MIKTYHLLRLAFTLFLTCEIFFTSNAHDFEHNGIFYNIINNIDKTVEVTYKGITPGEHTDIYTQHVTIPSSVTFDNCTYSVSRIGYAAFENCTKLTSVTIPESITEIRLLAFDECTNLTSINIPNSVTIIENGAFENCI